VSVAFQAVGLSPENAAQLQAYGQLAIAFAGFAGVIGAFSQFRMHAKATAFRVRAMVVLALGEAVFTLLPTLIADFGIAEHTVWRISAGALAGVAAALVVVLARQASILYRVGHLMRNAAYALCVGAVALILPLGAAALGVGERYAAAWYFALLFFGIITCAYHFTMLIIAVRLDPSDRGES
jgi:hypothetical protein